MNIIFLFLLLFHYSNAQEIIIYKNLPSVKLKTTKGITFYSDSITNNGNPIIISFWATWCKPCIRELTIISDVYDEWISETGVKIYVISIDDSRSMMLVNPLVNGKEWKFEVLLDPNGDFKRAMNVVTIPYTFILNGKGEVVYQHATFVEGDELNLIEIVRKLNNKNDK